MRASNALPFTYTFLYRGLLVVPAPRRGKSETDTCKCSANAFLAAANVLYVPTYVEPVLTNTLEGFLGGPACKY